MTDVELKRRAITVFKPYEVSKDVKRKYQRQWIHSIRTLGPKWKLATKVERLAVPI